MATSGAALTLSEEAAGATSDVNVFFHIPLSVCILCSLLEFAWSSHQADNLVPKLALALSLHNEQNKVLNTSLLKL